MALVFDFYGDFNSEFRVVTDAERNHNEFHITELRGITFSDVMRGADLEIEEIDRNTLLAIGTDHGYRLVENDDQDQVAVRNDPPRISTSTPTRGGNLGNTANIVLNFTENVARAASTGPTVKLINLTTNAVVQTWQFDTAGITIASAAVTINPTANLVATNEYSLLIDAGYFTNTGATEDHGGIYDPQFFTFTAT